MYISPDINKSVFIDKPGKTENLDLLKKDKWLMDTEVKYILFYKKGMWHLRMIFIDVTNPFKFICRSIDKYTSEKRALTYASIFQRGIRKDARGTLKSNTDAFNICKN